MLRSRVFAAAQAFDEMLLLKRGGQAIYNGPLGFQSQAMIAYFGAIRGMPAISPTANPATWMLDISTIAAEQRLGADLAAVFSSSTLARYAHTHNFPCGSGLWAHCMSQARKFLMQSGGYGPPW